MARFLFGPDLIVKAPAPPGIEIAPAEPFTLWSARTGGSQYTDCLSATGGVLSTNGSGAFLCDSGGQRPPLQGPDGVMVMWCDTGSGSRYVMHSSEAKASTANPVFTGTVTVPDGALAIADTSGLQVALDATVKLTGTQTVAGVKTFSSAPVVPSASFPQSAVTNLTTDLGLKADAANPVFTGTVTVPDGALAIADTAGLQTALDGAMPRATVRWAIADDYSLDLTGTTTHTATQVQAWLDDAVATGRMAYAAGTLKCSGTIVIKGDVDLHRLTLNYTGAGMAVQIIGPTTSTRLDAKTINLPKVVCAGKPATGWTAGTIGVQAMNVSACLVSIPQIIGFETGLDMTSNVTGNVYNTVIIGALDNNKVNHWINPTNGGWVNNNTFIGGRFSHFSGEGIAVAGTKHIYITQGTGTVANMNVWINTSIETGPGIVEYGIDIEAGLYNVFSNPRVEANGTAPNDRISVRWGPGALKNVIRDGYSLSTKLKQVYDGGSANYIDSQSLVEHQASGATTPFRRYENATSSSGPVLGVYAAGTLSNTTPYNPDTEWSAWLSATAFSGKGKADAFERVKLDLANGRTYYGTGAAAVTKYLGNFGSSLCVAGSSLVYATHNTYDFGSTTQAPKDIYAAGRIFVGAAQEIAGTGSPLGVVSAPVGSTYRRTDGAASTTFYVKESGTGSTGWVAYGPSGGAAVVAPGLSGFVGWAFDPGPSTMAGTTLVAGTLTGTRVHLPTDSVVTNLVVYVNTAGAGLTAGECFAALYPVAGGAPLGVTADQSTAWTSTGVKVMPLAGGALALTAGFYDLVFWANGTTPPFLLRGQSSVVVNLNTSSNPRFFTADTGVTTTAPATRGTKTSSAVSWWAGLS